MLLEGWLCRGIVYYFVKMDEEDEKMQVKCEEERGQGARPIHDESTKRTFSPHHSLPRILIC